MEKALREAVASAAFSMTFLAGLARDNSLIDRGGAAASRFVEAVERHWSARERMTVSNLRLVLSIAKRYRGMRLPFEDLVQEGNLGLMKAVERYDWRRGLRFSTYATWWIRQNITRAIAEKGRLMRTPVHIHDAMLKISREADDIERMTGRKPSVAILAKRLSMTSIKVGALLQRMEEPISLQEPGESDIPSADLVEDPNSKDPFVFVALMDLRKTLVSLLQELDPKSAEVLCLRFGVDGSDSLTLEEVGSDFGVTRERIRQIESNGLRKLSHPVRGDILRPWLEMEFTDVQEILRVARMTFPIKGTGLKPQVDNGGTKIGRENSRSDATTDCRKRRSLECTCAKG